jgi:Tol biopolymer transport system component
MDSVSPAFSPDGNTLYVIGEELRGELQHFDPSSKQFVPYLSGISAEMADLSRDGQWVAYVAYPEGNLWRSRIDGTERLQLTFPPLIARVPRWSPDGKRIVFHSRLSGQGAAALIISADGGAAEPVTPKQFHVVNPGWSQDGASVIFSCFPLHDRSPDIVGVFAVDLQSGQVRRVPGSEDVFAPDMSPDGRYIVGSSARNGHAMLFDARAGSWTEVPAGASIRRWSRDSLYFYFLQRGPNPAVMRMRVSDQSVEQVASLSGFRLAGHLAGISFTLDPQESPVILRDAGIQEIYSLAWKAR